MRILVTGASGFLGTHLVPALERAGHDVAGTWLGPPGAGCGYEVDLTDPDTVRAAVGDFRPECIVHLAGASHVGTSWSQMGLYHRVNVVGTQAVLDAADGIPVVMASSAEVYGPVPPAEQPITEDRAPDPANPYALTKAAAELLVLRARGIVLRLFNLIGPGQDERFALPTFAAQLRSIERGEREPVLSVGNLDARRDFVHVFDGAEAVVRVVEGGEAGSVYQVASGRAWRVGEVLDRLISASGIEAQVEVDPERFRPNDIPLLVGSATRLQRLGWRAQRTVDEAVADLWNSLRPVSELAPQGGE